MAVSLSKATEQMVFPYVEGSSALPMIGVYEAPFEFGDCPVLYTPMLYWDSENNDWKVSTKDSEKTNIDAYIYDDQVQVLDGTDTLEVGKTYVMVVYEGYTVN